MEKRKSFFLTWPSILVYVPFIILIVVMMFWVLIAPHPESLVTSVSAMREWAGSMLVSWLIVAVVLNGVYRMLRGKEQGGRHDET